MRYIKILGLPAVIAATMMAFAAPASADYVTTTTGGAAETPTIHAVNEIGHVSLANSSANIECASTVEGDVTSHGAFAAVSGHIDTLSFFGCTNGWTVTVNGKGSLSIEHTTKHDGTLSSTGATVTAIRHTVVGTVECRYFTNNTHIGTVTGGSPATLKIEGSIPFHSGGGFCGSGSAQWTGSYLTTSALYIVKS